MAIDDIVSENMTDTSSEVTDGSSVVIDHNHPLFLGGSDSTLGAFHIRIQLVDMENSSLWSRAMKVALLVTNKLGFIDSLVRCEDYRRDLVK